MKRSFKALLLGGLIFTFAITGTNIHAKSDSLMNISGTWEFKSAEYLEKASPSQSHQVKYAINSVKDLYAHSRCFQETVIEAHISNGVAMMRTLVTSLVGEYYLLPQPSNKKKSIMFFGNFESIGKDSPFHGIKYNAPNIQYSVEVIDENTIGITLERRCHEGGAYIDSAIRCIMKKND